MPKQGWIRNRTNVQQWYGSLGVEPGAMALFPEEIVQSLKRHPLIELEVIDETGPNWVFKRTEHRPFSERYKR